MPEFCGVDETIAIFVKDSEPFHEVLHRTFVLFLLAREEDRKELLETDSLVA